MFKVHLIPIEKKGLFQLAYESTYRGMRVLRETEGENEPNVSVCLCYLLYSTAIRLSKVDGCLSVP